MKMRQFENGFADERGIFIPYQMKEEPIFMREFGLKSKVFQALS